MKLQHKSFSSNIVPEMQGMLIDLNIVADNMTFDNIQSIKSEIKELKENNESMTERIEGIFSDRLRKEEAVLEVEKVLTQVFKKNLFKVASSVCFFKQLPLMYLEINWVALWSSQYHQSST